MSKPSFADQFRGVRGYTCIYSTRAGILRSMFFHKNQVMDKAALAMAKLWGGSDHYRVGAMYFEFQNLSDPGDTPAYPSFTKSEGIEYYTGLQYAYDKDFLRVPVLVSPAVTETLNGYLLTLHALAPDTDTGFWGKSFTGASNSVVIGGALVATVDDSQSNDIVLCRNYPPGTKIPKVDGEQIGMTWNVEFRFPEES